MRRASVTIAIPRRHSPVPKQLDAGPFEAEVNSFRLHLAAEGKAGRTLHTYTGAVRWFAAAHLLRETDKASWEQVEPTAIPALTESPKPWLVRK
jgi:hypothetical protein